MHMTHMLMIEMKIAVAHFSFAATALRSTMMAMRLIMI